MEMQTDNPRGYRDPTAMPNSGLSPESLALSGAQDAGDVSRVRSILSSLPRGTSLPISPEQFLANARFRSATNDLEDASESGDVERVRSIIDAWRADPSLKDPRTENMKSSLIRAAVKGKAGVVRFLMDEERVPVNAAAPSFAQKEGGDPDPDGDGPVGVFQSFFDHGWDVNSFQTIPTLNRATKSYPLTKWFLDHGANPNLISTWGHTALDSAASSSGPDQHDTIDLLISSGALLTHSNTIHNALISFDNDTDCFEMIEFLLSRGVDINALSFINQPDFQTWKQSTPLHWAVGHHQRRRGRKNMLVKIKWLLEHGADRELRDSKGQRPIDEAKREDLIKLLEST